MRSFSNDRYTDLANAGMINPAAPAVAHANMPTRLEL